MDKDSYTRNRRRSRSRDRYESRRERPQEDDRSRQRTNESTGKHEDRRDNRRQDDREFQNHHQRDDNRKHHRDHRERVGDRERDYRDGRRENTSSANKSALPQLLRSKDVLSTEEAEIASKDSHNALSALMAIGQTSVSDVSTNQKTYSSSSAPPVSSIKAELAELEKEIREAAELRRFWQENEDGQGPQPKEIRNDPGRARDSREAKEGMQDYKNEYTKRSNEEEEEEEDDGGLVCVYYCEGCGMLSLVLGARLKDLPIRDLDESVILSEKEYKVQVLQDVERLAVIKFSPTTSSSSSSSSSMVAPLHQQGTGNNDDAEQGNSTTPCVEKQWRIHCKGCDLPLMYRHEPKHHSTEDEFGRAKGSNKLPSRYPFVYVLKGSLTDNPSALELSLRHERDRRIRESQQEETSGTYIME